MTTNHLIGLISSICLGLVILWTLFRKDKKVYLKTYNSTPKYEHSISGSFTGKDFEDYWKSNSAEDITTHSKVLEDIKKVEKDSDESRFVNQMSRPEIRQVDLERKKDL